MKNIFLKNPFLFGMIFLIVGLLGYQELKSFGMTHVFINDFVVKKWELEKAWLNQSAFKDKYLNKIIEVNGQHLYQINKEI